MTSRILAAPALGAVAVAAMLAATTTSTEAFTLSAPSVEKSVAGADIDHVYYYHGGATITATMAAMATMPATTMVVTATVTRTAATVAAVGGRLR